MARMGFGRKNGNGSTNGTTNAKTAQTASGTATMPAPSAPPAPPVSAATVREVKPSLEQVRQKAFELYQARAKAGRPGDSTTDWLEAERQLKTAPAHQSARR